MLLAKRIRGNCNTVDRLSLDLMVFVDLMVSVDLVDVLSGISGMASIASGLGSGATVVLL